MKTWQEDLLIVAAGVAFWVILWIAYLIGQGEL